MFYRLLLKPYNTYCHAFIDNIIIFSLTAKEHVEHLDTIFGLFNSMGISMSLKKLFLGYPLVELLGFNVDAFSMSTTKECIQAFRDLDFPYTLWVLESYLGASGFLQHLILYYVKLAEPLQARKIVLLAEGRAQGCIVNGNP